VSRFGSPKPTGAGPRTLVIAGTSSSVGKTTVTLGLLEAFKRRGLTVQAFKVGPDFIDPGYHYAVTGRPSYNLDGWMCGRQRVLEIFSRHAASADLAIIEGVMGCFDGSEGKSEAGSTAEIAKWLEAPVVLVVDASAMARSAGAVVLGFERFDPDLEVIGVIWNRVGGEGHAQWLNESLSQHCRARPFGWLPRRDSLSLPERHLGLVTAEEHHLDKKFLDELSELVTQQIDIDMIISLATSRISGVRGSGSGVRSSGNRETRLGMRIANPETRLPNPEPRSPKVRIGVAWDEAFLFYYPENLDRLRDAGAELVFWSPLREKRLPAVDGLYFGGGYPELYGGQLAENASIRKAVKEFALEGKPIYAECGGLMYLAETLQDLDGVSFPMVGLLPTTVRMTPRRLTLAYTEVEFTTDAILGPQGSCARGHEFHYSTMDPVPDSIPRVYRLRQKLGGERAEGYRVNNALMSYVHLHFASNPDLATRIVEACERNKKSSH
jgi:cobyrinic acid a,c-diamide synthase